MGSIGGGKLQKNSKTPAPKPGMNILKDMAKNIATIREKQGQIKRNIPKTNRQKRSLGNKQYDGKNENEKVSGNNGI